MSTGPNAEQFDAWNGDSGTRWTATADTRDAVLAPVADLLHDAAATRPGDRLVDIGCGCGATTLAAAGAAAPTGAALGVDLSQPMLQVARRRARVTGLTNVSFRQIDAQTDPLDGPHDIAVSRFGTMFFADPTAAFANIAAHLRPAGRLCMVTWQPLAANEWLVVPGAALLELGTLPDAGPPGSPGMFAQADPATIETTLAAAGFDDVDVTPHTVPLALGVTVDDALGYLVDSGPGRAILDTIPAERHDRARDAVRQALLRHGGTGPGVTLDAAVWLTTATRRPGLAPRGDG